MIKIRTVVAHNNEEIRNIIVNSISNLEYVEVVGTATDGIETYNKIVELKPEMLEAIHITGNKINAFVSQPYDGSAKNIIKAYKEYKYN